MGNLRRKQTRGGRGKLRVGRLGRMVLSGPQAYNGLRPIIAPSPGLSEPLAHHGWSPCLSGSPAHHHPVPGPISGLGLSPTLARAYIWYRPITGPSAGPIRGPGLSVTPARTYARTYARVRMLHGRTETSCIGELAHR